MKLQKEGKKGLLIVVDAITMATLLTVCSLKQADDGCGDNSQRRAPSSSSDFSVRINGSIMRPT